MKRIVSLLLALMTVCSMAVFSAGAAEEELPTVVSVKVDLAGWPGMYGGTVAVVYAYDADGNASTTADRMEVVYTIPLTGKAGGEIARNGYYRVAANITGLVGQDCQVSVSVAEWETPVTQSVDLGA